MTEFEIVIILAIGLLGYMGLAVYTIRVIDQQRELIKQMQTNPKCMVAPTIGGRV